jgi:hypothetical protein
LSPPPVEALKTSTGTDPAAQASAAGCPPSNGITAEPPLPSPEVAAPAPSVEDETGKPDPRVRTSTSRPPRDERRRPLTPRPVVGDGQPGSRPGTDTSSDNNAEATLPQLTWYPCTSATKWVAWQSADPVLARVRDLRVSWEDNPDDAGKGKSWNKYVVLVADASCLISRRHSALQAPLPPTLIATCWRHSA